MKPQGMPVKLLPGSKSKINLYGVTLTSRLPGIGLTLAPGEMSVVPTGLSVEAREDVFWSLQGSLDNPKLLPLFTTINQEELLVVVMNVANNSVTVYDNEPLGKAVLVRAVALTRA